jgi:two-component system NtrC family sensor kinase
MLRYMAPLHEIKYKAEVVRQYDAMLPRVPCLPAQVNQVVMNLLVNAAQAIEVLARIFDPFYTTKPVGKGTRLGLSISYDIVSKHRGRIDVRSEPGCGCTFRVSLPRVAPA